MTGLPETSPGQEGRGREVLLTGATGFVGKVALEMLLRRREELGIDRVHLLVRARGDRTPRERFEVEIAPSSCFSRLPAGWTDHVEVFSGDISVPGCDMSAAERAARMERITHVLHAAASIEFDLPLDEALGVNTHGSLNMLELAREAPLLERMVAVSTAYVTTHPADGAPVEEVLAPLPRPAAEIHGEILEGRADEAALLRETGHPNTYTLTKCLGEHLLDERRGAVPLRVVRPSIVSASWREPFPGWIDSRAAFAAFVALAGSGYLRAVAARLDAKVDIVPVDVVVGEMLAAAFQPDAQGTTTGPAAPLDIRHAVSGLDASPTSRQCRDHVVEFFRRYPAGQWPDIRHVGPSGRRFAFADLRHHAIRIRLGALLTGRWRAGSTILGHIRMFNRSFPYFTQHTFDFRARARAEEERPDVDTYLDTVCGGVYRHLLRRDETQVPLAGRRGPHTAGDLAFARRREGVGFAFRAAAWLVTKALRRIADEVTFDLASFRRAQSLVPDGASIVLAPTHRSYLDFVLSSYLCFARPDLGIPMPRIAAASEFGRIPVLGHVLERLGAFYIERGLGREDETLTARLHGLVHDDQALEFFIEGQRSRSRHFLPPKRGIVRALQGSGVRLALLPIAISYERVPEEASLVRELAGEARPRMRLSGLLMWTVRAFLGRVRIGRIHIAAGTPVFLDPARDAGDIGREVLAEHQRATTVTQLHLAALLAHEAEPGLTPADLAAAVRARGLVVLESDPDAVDVTDRRALATLRRQVEHVTYAEARLLLEEHPVVSNHLRLHDYRQALPAPAALGDGASIALVRLVFAPLCRDHVRVTCELERALRNGGPVPGPAEIVVRRRECELPNVEAAYADLERRGVLQRSEAGWAFGEREHELAACRAAYAWPAVPEAAEAAATPALT